MDAIILAGGQGKRLRPLTDSVPKPMVTINGKPMLQYHIDWLKKYGVENIIVACGYKWQKIRERYGNSLIYSVEKKPLGTGGAIKTAMKHVKSDEFIVVNCDDINNVNIDKLRKMGSHTICLSKFPSPFGVVEVKNGKVVNFRQKPILPHWASIGVYLLNKKIQLKSPGAIETDLFEDSKVELKAYKHRGFWVTVNTMKDLEEAEKFFKKYPMESLQKDKKFVKVIASQ